MARIKDIEDALMIHCRRRARHLCKIYADEHGTDVQECKMMYSELKVRYGLENLN
jgi:hypothetical protein